MFGYLDFLFLSYSGRIGRTAYWLGYLAILAIQIAAFWLLVRIAHEPIDQLLELAAARARHLPPELLHALWTRLLIPALIISLVFQYPYYALIAKRWHDRDKSGWWSLIGFIPIIGGLWMLIELGFLGPSSPVNQYGMRE
jgi:uncharacterized membrane protein YhaH (DUF805 family)